MRQITVDGQQYRVRVGHSFTRLTTERATSRYIPNHVILGLTPADFERGQWKKTSDGMVIPSMLRKYIHENL